MKKPTHADGYTTRTTEAVRRALMDVAHLLGSFREQIVVVGGLVPSLTVQPLDGRPHAGTIDIDLALDAEKLREGDAYARVVELLERGGFERGVELEHENLREFQMMTMVDLQDGGAPVRVELDLLKPRKAKISKHRPPLIKEFRALDMDGLDLAIQHSQYVTLNGPDRNGRADSATIKVVGAEAFLMLKGLALPKRRERKDCYDIYYVIRNAPFGAERLGESCRMLLAHPEAEAAYGEIRDKFSALGRYGPGSVLDFLQGREELDDDTILMDAHQQVTAWAEGLFSMSSGHAATAR